MWHSVINDLDESGRIVWDEFFIDGSFAPARKGRRHWKNQARKGYEVYGGGGWLGNTFGMLHLLGLARGSQARLGSI